MSVCPDCFTMSGRGQCERCYYRDTSMHYLRQLAAAQERIRELEGALDSVETSTCDGTDCYRAAETGDYHHVPPCAVAAALLPTAPAMLTQEQIRKSLKASLPDAQELHRKIAPIFQPAPESGRVLTAPAKESAESLCVLCGKPVVEETKKFHDACLNPRPKATPAKEAPRGGLVNPRTEGVPLMGCPRCGALTHDGCATAEVDVYAAPPPAVRDGAGERPCATCGKPGHKPMDHAGWDPRDEGHG